MDRVLVDCYSRIDYSHWNVYGTFHGAYSPLCVICRLTEMQSTEYEEHHAHTVALFEEHKGTSKVLQSVL